MLSLSSELYYCYHCCRCYHDIIIKIIFQAPELHSHSSAERTFPISGRHCTFRSRWFWLITKLNFWFCNKDKYIVEKSAWLFWWQKSDYKSWIFSSLQCSNSRKPVVWKDHIAVHGANSLSAKPLHQVTFYIIHHILLSYHMPYITMKQTVYPPNHYIRFTSPTTFLQNQTIAWKFLWLCTCNSFFQMFYDFESAIF